MCLFAMRYPKIFFKGELYVPCMYEACTNEMNNDSGAMIATNPTKTLFCVTLLTL